MTKKIFLMLILFFAANPLNAVESISADVFESALNSRIDKLEKNVNDLQKVILTAPHSDGEDAQATARKSAMNYAKLEELKEQMKLLRNDIDLLQLEHKKLQEQLTKFALDAESRLSALETKSQSDNYADTDNRLNLSSSENKPTVNIPAEINRHDAAAIAVDSDSTKTSKKRQKAKSDADYELAVSLFKNKQYKKSQEALEQFISRHPDSELVADAHHLLGNIYFTRTEYDNAASEYLKGYQTNPKGNKAPNNLLGLGKSMAKLEKHSQACTAYMKLQKEFTNLPAVIKKELAEDIKQYKCAP